MQVVLDGLRLAVGLAAISELQYILLCVCVCNLPEKNLKKVTNQRTLINFSECFYSR